MEQQALGLVAKRAVETVRASAKLRLLAGAVEKVQQQQRGTNASNEPRYAEVFGSTAACAVCNTRGKL